MVGCGVRHRTQLYHLNILQSLHGLILSPQSKWEGGGSGLALST